jgi:hypothetical protein
MVPINTYDGGKPQPVARTITSTSNVVRCPTPMPDNVPTDDNNEAWDPNAPTPIPVSDDRTERPIHWLENDSLKSTRMKLFVHERPNNILEFKEVVGNEVKVRDGRLMTHVPLDAVHAVRPKEVGELVTPLTGPMAGIALKVRKFQDDDCVVRRPGTVLRKNETDPTFPIACLIHIFPYHKS